MASDDAALRATLETLGDVAFTVDGEGRYDLVTDDLAGLHGSERDDLVGEESFLVERLREDENEGEECWATVRELIAGECEDLRVEVAFDDHGGERTVLDLRLSRHTVDGEFDSVVVVGRDVTADRRRRTALEALHEVATSIQTEDTVAGVCERVVTAAADVLEFTTCAVLIREDDWLVPYATSTDAPPDATHRMRVDQGGAGRTYRTGTTQVADDFGTDPDADPAKSSYRSGLSVPIGEHGVFQAVSTDTGAFDETDVELAELLVSHVESAIDRIEREKVVTALHDVATTIQTEDTVDGVAERTVGAAETILDFDNCIIFRPEGDRMAVLAMSEEFPAEEIESLPMEGSVAGLTYRTGEPYNVGDASNHPVANPQGPYESGLSVPIGGHGVCQMIATEPDAFDSQDREFAELLVSHTASAIDRIERERDLRMYEAIVEAVDAGVYVVDDDRYIEFVNDSYVEMKGVDRSEFLGTKITEWGNDSDIERIVEQVEEIRRGERDMVKIDYDFRSVDGDEFPVELRITPLTFPNGEPGRVGIIRDISERKRYERRLEKQADQLETLNRIVRHDISNDMNVVLAMTNAVRERIEDEQLTDYLDRVLATTRHTVELTRSVRDLMETMLAEDREHGPVSLQRTLEEEIDDVTESADADIRVEGSIPYVMVLADNMLSSVFRNLLQNAVQHNDAPDPEVIVSAETVDGRARVRIADNGPGIPDDRKADIFGQGERGLDSEGTGIGLYLVQTLVDSYGGSVRVEDREERGSVFVVELERAHGD